MLPLLLSLAALTVSPSYASFQAREDAVPIDQLRTKLGNSSRSKKAARIGQAWDDLAGGRFQKVRQSAKSLLSDPLFADYGQYLAGLADRMEASSRNQSRSYADALKLARSAIGHFARLESSQPYSPWIKKVPDEIAAAELEGGRALLGKKKWRESEDEYEKAFQLLAAQGNLNLLRSAPLENYGQACAQKSGPMCGNWAQRIAQTFPRNSLEIQALARHLPDESVRVRPLEKITRLTQPYKATDPDQAAFDAAFGMHLQGKKREAIQALEQMLNDFPKSTYRFRARYWLGKIYELDGESDLGHKSLDALIQDSPLTYYGLLASLARGVGIQNSISNEVPLARDTDPLLTPLESIRLRRASQFLAEKRPILAAEELKELRARDALSSPFLLDLAALQSEAGNHGAAFSILGELIQRGYEGVATATGLKLIFPTPYLPLVRKYAKEYKLDPALVMSLIKQESAFDSRANSPVGASGLMQLMHATALDTDPTIERADLIETEANLRVGCRYLRQLLTRFNGNTVLALAGYNAGPAAVDRWSKDFGKGRGMLEFIELIPFKGTRDYVSSIIRNYFWYAPNVGGEGFRTLESFWTAQSSPSEAKPIS